MATGSPLSSTKADRRRLLTRHFIEILEPLMEGGERYADFTIERLLKESNVPRSSFYGYFTDKGDLLEAMAEDIEAELVQSGGSWWAFPDDGTQDDLRKALEPSIDVHRRHHEILGALAEAAAYDDKIRARYEQLIAWIIDRLEAHIRDAQAAGTASPDIEPRTTAQWLIWMHERGLHQLVGPASDRQADQLVSTLTAIVWRSLYADARR